MLRLRIAVATAHFGLPLRQAILRAAQAGADAVHLDARSEIRPEELSETGRRQLLHCLDELNLRVASLSFPTRHAFYEYDALEARLDATRAAMQFTRQLGATVLTIQPGTIPDSGSPAYGVLSDVLNDLSRFGNHVGATLGLTSGGLSSQAVAQLLTAVTTGPIAIDFDPLLSVLSGHSPAEDLRVLQPFVQHIRVRDAVRRVDDSVQEVAVGRGEVEWDELLALIDETSYSGWLCVERSQGDDRAGDSERAIAFLRSIASGV